MANVYVCIYATDNDCLLFAKKKTRGFFFNGRKSEDPSGAILNYSGQHVLPGGKTNVTEVAKKAKIEAEALREFKEETGSALTSDLTNNTVKSFDINGKPITSGDAVFHCLYIPRTAAEIAALKENITLCLSKTAEDRLALGMDDELAKVTVKTIKHARERLTLFVAEWADPGYGGRQTDKSWFGNIVDNLPA